MALIAVVTHDTPDNDRWWMTQATLKSLAETVDLETHRIIVVDNGSTDERTINFLFGTQGPPHLKTEVPTFIIRNEENVGTARAINMAWEKRHPNEVAVKMDNDVVIHYKGWLDVMEDAFTRDPSLGILGLKRADLEESPWHQYEGFRSTVLMLGHTRGQRWITVEKVNHVIGTCQAYSPALLEKIGYLEQGSSLYGFDDSLSAVRCVIAGFYSAFLCNIAIDHIDPGGTNFTQWKSDVAGEHIARYTQAVAEYNSGKRPLYCGPEGRPW